MTPVEAFCSLQGIILFCFRRQELCSCSSQLSWQQRYSLEVIEGGLFLEGRQFECGGRINE